METEITYILSLYRRSEQDPGSGRPRTPLAKQNRERCGGATSLAIASCLLTDQDRYGTVCITMQQLRG